MKNLLLILLISGGALAQTTQGLTVEPLPRALRAELKVKDTYYPGESLEVAVKVSDEAYIYLFSVDPRGHAEQIFPNRYQKNNRLQANRTYRFPPASAAYHLRVELPAGTHKVICLAARSQLSPRALQSVRGTSAELSLTRALEAEPLLSSDWMIATQKYQVRSR